MMQGFLGLLRLSASQTPALMCVRHLGAQLYLDSMQRFPGMTSPYLYTLYGLGELPQAFARLAAARSPAKEFARHGTSRPLAVPSHAIDSGVHC